MTRAETAELLTLIAAAWPRFEPDDARVVLWDELLSDIEFRVAKVALKKLMILNTFPPSVAELRQAVAEVTRPADSRIPAPEAWGLAIKAIHEYGYYREAEAMKNLPESVAQVVRWMGYQQLCLSENTDVIRGQFMRMYETQQKRETEQAVLPPGLKQDIARLAEGVKMEQRQKNKLAVRKC